MQIRLEKTDNITGVSPLIYIARKTSDLSLCNFSEVELNYVKKRIERSDELITIPDPGHDKYLVVTDESKPLVSNLETLRRLGAGLVGELSKTGNDQLQVHDTANDPEMVVALTEGIVLGSYRFEKYITRKKKRSSSLEVIKVNCPGLKDGELNMLQSLCRAVFHARDLVNEPLSHLNAAGLAGRISEMGKEAGFSVEIMEKDKIVSLGMGGLLAVNKGSVDPPTFTILEWKPETHINTRPIVLAGKGVVYDTGGLSLKPTANAMDYMKCDMAGAATVAGTIFAASSCRLPLHIIGLVPATDNRPDGNAIVPGDIITMFDGTTVEVLNTDAEGRLLLGDALSWAKRYDPEVVIDVATLTGSAAAALGTQGMAVMHKTADEFYRILEKSSYYIHERTVLLPLWDEYGEMIKSDVADLKNIGGKEAGTITAGKFLEHFTSYPWIHLDIAGLAFLQTADGYRPKGGTGTGVRLLFDFLRNYPGTE